MLQFKLESMTNNYYQLFNQKKYFLQTFFTSQGIKEKEFEKLFRQKHSVLKSLEKEYFADKISYMQELWVLHRQ